MSLDSPVACRRSRSLASSPLAGNQLLLWDPCQACAALPAGPGSVIGSVVHGLVNQDGPWLHRR